MISGDRETALVGIRSEVIDKKKLQKEKQRAKKEHFSWFDLLGEVLIVPGSADNNKDKTGDGESDKEEGERRLKIDPLIKKLNMKHGEQFRAEIRHIVRVAIRNISL